MPILNLQKGAGHQLSEHFNQKEFDCRCSLPSCATTLISEELVQALEVLREVTGPISIDCGYRCPDHNKAVGGVPDSQHVLGKAADIKTPLGPDLTAYNAENGPFKKGGVGRYPTFTHVDVRGTPARWRKK